MTGTCWARGDERGLRPGAGSVHAGVVPGLAHRGSALQLGKVSRLLLAELARRAGLLPGAGTLAFTGVGLAQRRACGHAKQGAAFRHAKRQAKTVLARKLNALAAAICPPRSAPVIAAARLRGKNASTARDTARLIAEAVRTARHAGCTGIIVARGDPACYSAALAAAISAIGGGA